LTATAPNPTIEHLLRDLAPQVLGVVARRHSDFSVAEDAVQEALIAAATQWPAQGIPKNPRGWLYHVALRRLTDHVRSEIARQRREEAVANEVWAEWAFVPPPTAEVDVSEDDTLALLFMCCHPSLTTPSAIALTLRAVGGLTTAEIAAAFLIPEATMAQRISRAKASIKASNIRFELPSEAERGERLAAVLHVLYLMYNEGYASSSGVVLQRTDLSNEAIRLARLLRALLPADGEVAGLLALLILTDARRAARAGPHGEIIPLDEQDRGLWDRAQIAEGLHLLDAALSHGTAGAYQLQAAIAAVHDRAPSSDATDWREIESLYDMLMRVSDNPMVALNRAIAVAMVRGPSASLAIIDALDADSRIAGHYRLDAVRGHLYERSGDFVRAVEHFRRAAERTASGPERDYLVGKALGATRALETKP
jgi:RNA polymerase sigma factor (sigma-70 family)